MKVRFKSNTKWNKRFVRAGDEIEVDDKTGADLVSRGVAEEAKDVPKAAPAKPKQASLEVDVVNANKAEKGAKK